MFSIQLLLTFYLNKMKHLHHQFWAGDEPSEEYKKDHKDQYILNPVKVTVIDCQTEEEALSKAKEILPRDKYAIESVWECSSCAAQEESLANQRYLTAMFSKHFRDNHE